MRFYPSVVRALVLSSLAFVGAAFAQQVVPSRALVVQRVDETALATLKGNTRPEARAAYDRGTVSPTMAMPGMVLVLRRTPEQEAAIVAYADSLQDPKSANYHHWLTPTQQGALFGPAQTDLEAITNWLQSHGFTVDDIAPNRMAITFSGTAAQTQAAFHTEIHNLNVKGDAHIANMSDPQIPAALAPAVVGVQSLHNFFARPMHKLGSTVKRDSQTGKWQRIASPFAAAPVAQAATVPGALTLPAPLFNTGGISGGSANIEDIGPYDFATIYNVLPLWNASSPIDGKGQTIAIVGTSDINPADLTTFRAAFGLPAYAAATGSTPGFSVIHPNTAPGACSNAANSCDGDLTENSLDVEWAGAVAKNANIVLVASSAAAGTAFSADPVYIGSNYIVTNHTASIVNVSYGLCELGLGTAGNAGWNSLWQTAAVSGIAVFVSTGDSGSAVCDGGGDSAGNPYGAQYGLSVSGLASTPYNVAVGGTDFNWAWLNGGQAKYWSTTNTPGTLASATGYIPEAPWNSTCSNAFFDASVNSQLGQSYSAATICNAFGTGQLRYSSDPNLGYELVDTIGGSGGISNCTTNDNSTVASCTGGYAKPSWQAGVTGIPADGKRDVPDISFFAANGFSGSAYVICVSANGACSYTAGTEPTGQEVGGTSVSSPIMAGVMALINQQAGAAQGLPNAVLYKLASKQTYSGCTTESTGSGCYFNDIDTGTIAMPCVGSSPNCSLTTAPTSSNEFGLLTGYSSTAGFDLATGLGSLNIANVVNAYAATATPVATLSATSLTFASTAVGSTTAAQSVTVTNSGLNPLVVSSVAFTGANTSSYSQTNNCTSVTTGNSCTINVIFQPQAVGALPSTLQITDNAAGSLQTVSLTGTGLSVTPVAVLSATSLQFTSTTIGSSSAAQTVTLTNTGSSALTVTGITVTGANPTSFTQTNNCSSVVYNASCTISVIFTPQAVGALAATISIADNATGSPQAVTLQGVGLAVAAPAVTLSPSSLNFSSTVGVSSAAQTVTVTNSGNATLTITSVTVTGTSASAFTPTSTCTSVAAGATCSISVTFKPTAAGSLTAAISIADNATGSPQTVTLTGTATAPVATGSLTLTAAAATVAHGSTTTSAITATGTNGYVGASTVTLKSCTLATSPTGAVSVPTCTITTPSVVFAAGASTGSGGLITISTTASTSAMLGHDFDRKTWTGAAGVALAGALFFFIPRKRRTWGALLSILFLVGTLGVMSGCGGSSSPSGSSGTTTGAYTFTVTGTDANSNTATATLSLTVN